MSNRSRYNTRKLALYVARKLAPANHKSKLPLIDIYEQYKTFAQDEGVIALTVGDLSHMITEFYKDVKIDGGVAIGLQYRIPWQDEPKPEPVKIDKQQIAMLRRLDQFLYDIPIFGHGGPFTAEAFAGYQTTQLVNGSYECGFAKIDVEYARDWLREHPHVFERNNKFYYRPN